MTEPDMDPLVRAVVEDRAHAISQLIMNARLEDKPFPGDDVRNVVNLSVGDNTIGYLCYFLASAYDVVFRSLLELKKGGSSTAA